MQVQMLQQDDSAVLCMSSLKRRSVPPISAVKLFSFPSIKMLACRSRACCRTHSDQLARQRAGAAAKDVTHAQAHLNVWIRQKGPYRQLACIWLHLSTHMFSHSARPCVVLEGRLMCTLMCLQPHIESLTCGPLSSGCALLEFAASGGSAISCIYSSQSDETRHTAKIQPGPSSHWRSLHHKPIQ